MSWFSLFFVALYLFSSFLYYFSLLIIYLFISVNMLRTLLKRNKFAFFKKNGITTSIVISSKLYSTNVRVLEQQKRHVKVTTASNNNTVYTLPYFWLRDHCRCSECYHSVTRQRLVNT